ncbi:hypothetical protein EC919_11486 [Pseudomonas graminis]|uniref:hypothetical protein n=1 Tax=Pseudomonas graminis TaxID=158627 RepID=UPI001061D8AF|nr:hypothetical protein [Pseudomonas graminis]TDV44414.1 hypothetical protein EC919_11486 [Pseudomonas graminis]
MSRYEDLHRVYNEVKESNDEYWRDLRRMIDSIRSDFSNYLDVGNDVINVAGVTRPIVAIGVSAEDGAFKNWATNSLPKQDSSIAFALCLSFPHAADAEPKPEFVYDLMIKKDVQGYWVIIPGWQDESFCGPAFTKLFDRLISLTGATIENARRL